MVGRVRHIIRKWKNLHANVLGINERNLRLVYRLNERKDYKLADDKIITKQILIDAGVPVAELIGLIKHVGNIAQKWAEADKRSCAIKPANGRGGGGILIIDYRDGQWYKGDRIISDREIHRHMANIIFGVYGFGNDDRVLIEEKIVPHHSLLEIYPKGVADLRIIAKEGRFVQAMLRIPTAKSDGRANLHQGALGVGVDLNTGRTTSAYDGRNYIDTHPDSGVALRGIILPFWAASLEVAKATADAFPLKYLGIDIAYDEQKGPLVLEVNVRPGLEIQNVNQQGMKALMEREGL